MNNAYIPEALKVRNQWLVWKLEDRAGKPSKVPYCAKTGRLGKSNDPASWCDFDTALKAALNGQGYDGIGFAFAEGDGLTGIDVDHPWNSPIAVKIREQFQGTYCEKSPRGKLRIFCYGKPHRCGKGTDDKSIEVYDHTSPRYMSVTGDWIRHTGTQVTDQQGALDWLHETYFKPKEKPESKRQPQAHVSLSVSDQEVIDKAKAARNGGKFSTLFYGGWEAAGYPSQSEAHAALCSMLAFWTQDEGQIDRIFRQSALMRPKWDKRHHADGRTYGQATIERALGAVTQTYQGTAQHAAQGKEKREEGTEGKESGPSGPAEGVIGAGDSESRERDSETIARLAKLSIEEYEGRRRDEAKELNWRISILDKAVEKARIKLWAERRAAEFAERQEEKEQPILCPDLGEKDHLDLVDQAIKDLGFGGDTKLPRLLYLSYTSRLLAFDIGNMLAHGQVVGAPSSGKNYAVDTVLALMPVEAYLKIDAGSPRALIYCDEDLRYRLVVFTEADSLPIGEGGGKSLSDGDSRSTAASALRNLASDGRLSYDIVERDPDSGQFVTRRIKKEGPTLLVTTTTKAIEGQMGTRLWGVHMLESDEQIRAALDKRVSLELTRQRSIPETLIAYQRYLQSRAPWDVIVPFAQSLVNGIVYKGMDPRILRDFQRLLALIKAVTVLRHPQREKDANGRWLAMLADYETVHGVLNDAYSATVNSGITEDVRAVVNTVAELRSLGNLSVTYDMVAKKIEWPRYKAHRKAAVALKHGWLINTQEKRGHPANLDLGDEMPEKRGLPLVKDLVEEGDA